MTKAAMNGTEKDTSVYGTRGDFVEIDAAGRNLPSVRIDGPYGAPAEDVFNSEVAILIGAGIGTCSAYSACVDFRGLPDLFFFRCDALRVHP